MLEPSSHRSRWTSRMCPRPGRRQSAVQQQRTVSGGVRLLFQNRHRRILRAPRRKREPEWLAREGWRARRKSGRRRRRQRKRWCARLGWYGRRGWCGRRGDHARCRGQPHADRRQARWNWWSAHGWGGWGKHGRHPGSRQWQPLYQSRGLRERLLRRWGLLRWRVHRAMPVVRGKRLGRNVHDHHRQASQPAHRVRRIGRLHWPMRRHKRHDVHVPG